MPASDDAGNLTTVTQLALGKQIATSYGYDTLNRRTVEIDAYTAANLPLTQWVNTPGQPVTRKSVMVYDASDNLISLTTGIDPNNQNIGNTGIAYAKTVVTQYQYDALNRQTKVIAGANDATQQRITSLTYDATGNLLSMQQPAPEGSPQTTVTTSYGYDEVNRQTTVIQAFGINGQARTTVTEYDGANNAIQVTDPLQNVTNTLYDAEGRPVQVVQAVEKPEQTLTTMTYDATGDLLSQTIGQAPAGADANTKTLNAKALYYHPETTNYGYDVLGRLTDIYQAANDPSIERHTRQLYDAAGNLILRQSGLAETHPADAHPVTSTFGYDALNRQTSESDDISPDGVGKEWRTTSMGYDEFGRLAWRQDALKNYTTYGYDALGRQISVTTPPRQIPAGIRGIITGRPDITSYAYDAAGNRVETVVPTNDLGSTVEVTTCSYNLFGQQLTQNQNSGPTDGNQVVVTKTQYDGAGDVTLVIDPNGNKTQYQYDALGDRVNLIDPFTKTVTYSYDLDGRQTAITDRRQEQRSFSYDALGRQTGQTWANAGDPAANPATISFAYDAAGNLVYAGKTFRVFSDGVTPTTTYTNLFQYNALNQVTQATDPLGGTEKYQYDAAGNTTLMTLTPPASWGGDHETSIDSNYDAANQLEGSNLAQVRSRANIDEAWTTRGQLHELTQSIPPLDRTAAKVESTYSYDGAGRLAAQQDSQQVAAPKFNSTLSYFYDAAGRVSTISSSAFAPQARTYTYDNLNQVVAEVNGVKPKPNRGSYSYDAAGNRSDGGAKMNKTHLLVDATYFYGNPIKDGSKDGSAEGGYDNEGNLIHKVSRPGPDVPGGARYVPTEDWEYSYDQANEMVRSIGPSPVLLGPFKEPQQSEKYYYDALGNRIQVVTREYQLVNQVWKLVVTTQQYLYSGKNVLAENTTVTRNGKADNTGAAQSFYLRDGRGQLLARVTWTASAKDPTTYFYVNDRQGSVLRLIPANANASDGRIFAYDAFGKQYAYDSSGKPLTASGKDPAPWYTQEQYGYTGQAFDALSGLQFNDARYYDPLAQHWLQEDPLGFAAGDANLYRYVFNEPTDFTDPWGLYGFWDWLANDVIGTENVRSWDNVLGDRQTGWFAQTSNFSAGMADTISGGLTGYVREGLGYDDVVDRRSGAYRYGGYAGQAVNIALMLANPVAGVRSTAGFFSTQVAGGFRTAFTAVNLMSTAGGLLNAGEEVLYGDPWKAIPALAGAGLSFMRGSTNCVLGPTERLGHMGLQLFGVAQSSYSAGEKFANQDYLGGFLDLMQAAVGAYKFQQVCFTAGTPLETPEGSKPIEQFRVGDLLLSRSEFDPHGPVEVKVVEETFVRTGRILKVGMCGRVIGTTAEHPFWLEGKGWTRAGDLRVGDRVWGKDRWVTVESLEDTGEWAVVYNLRVADYHTYFVGGREWGFSVWAHNANCVISQRRDKNELIDVANGNVVAEGSAAQVRKAAADGKHTIIETENLYKAPQPGKGEKIFQQGFLKEDFSDPPPGDNSAYLWKGRGEVDTWAGIYREGVLEVMIPKDVYQQRLQRYEQPYQGGPHVEVVVPHADFDVLNAGLRIYQRPGER